MLPVMRQILSGTGIVKSGLMGLYKFDEAADSQSLIDYSGNAYNFQNGSATGADANDATPGAEGWTFGGDDYAAAGDIFKYTTALTIQVVLKPASLSGYPVLFQKWAASPNKQYKLSSSFNGNGKPYMDISGTGSDDIYRSTNDAISTTAYWDIATVYDGAGLTLDMYRQGVLNNGASVGTIPAAIKNSASSMLIGRDIAGVYYSGLILYMLIYNIPLNANKIMQNHRAIKRAMAQRGVALG